ncbi:hypothetical protein, partial [Bacillus sp. SIMBA_033]|uniref:hypothetical protein n=1 Tax=Bacillus sp. SIMBA_033 TaxID=3085776 RepID=UPI00397CFC10
VKPRVPNYSVVAGKGAHKHLLSGVVSVDKVGFGKLTSIPLHIGSRPILSECRKPPRPPVSDAGIVQRRVCKDLLVEVLSAH